MRPGPRPTWSAHMVGTERTAPARTSAARALANAHIPCGLAARPGSTRLASLMDRSTAKASNPISRSSSCRRLSPATWSSWTIPAATRAMRCAGPFVAARLLFLPRYSSSPQSYRAGVRQAESAAPKGRRANCRSSLAAHRSSIASHHRTAPTTSETQDMLPPKWKMRLTRQRQMS